MTKALLQLLCSPNCKSNSSSGQEQFPMHPQTQYSPYTVGVYYTATASQETCTALINRFLTGSKGLLIPDCFKKCRVFSHTFSSFPSVSQSAPCWAINNITKHSTSETILNSFTAEGSKVPCSMDLLQQASNAEYFLEAIGVPIAGQNCGLIRVNCSPCLPLPVLLSEPRSALWPGWAQCSSIQHLLTVSRARSWGRVKHG